MWRTRRFVLERADTLTRRICSQHMEGSRFGVQPDNLAIFVFARLLGHKVSQQGGSRKLPSAMEFYEPGCKRIESHG